MLNNTGAFFMACFVLGTAALGIQQYQAAQPDPRPAIDMAKRMVREGTIELRLRYKAECERDERVLDHQTGKMVYDCASIATQVYPMPKDV
jgi:hypothetical protein